MDYRTESIVSNLKTHASAMGVPVEQVVGFKLRALRNRSEDSLRYLGSDVYDGLRTQFSLRCQTTTHYRGGRVFASQGAHVIEHESGPEILAAIVELGEAAAPFLSVVEIGTLVGGMALWIARKLRKPASSPAADDDYSNARYVRIEKREIGADGKLRETIVTVVDNDRTLEEKALVAAIQASLTTTKPARKPARTNPNLPRRRR